jgi:hypothetical protein
VRRLLTIVALSAGLLVAAAIAGAIIRGGPPEHLSQPEFTAMARSIGVGADGNSTDALCGHLIDDASARLVALDRDCRVSKRMATLKRRISTCLDVACVRPLADELVSASLEAERIERGFAADLQGDCRRFLEIEADYDAALAAAADHLVTLPGDAWFFDGMTRWGEASSAAEQAVDDEPILALLAGCDPQR